MMNRAFINFISVVIIVILAASVFLPIIDFAVGFSEGYSDSVEPTEAAAADPYTSPMVIGLNPDPQTLLNPVDTVRFQNGENYPIAYKEAIMLLPPSKAPGWTDTVFMISYLLNFIVFIILVVDFVKFVVNINKGKIFEKINARLLRRIALWLLLMSLCTVASGIAEEVSVSGLGMQLAGYELTASWSIPWNYLLLGALSLLMSHVWSRGIELREDQEFTI